jgi:hypothetical protein
MTRGQRAMKMAIPATATTSAAKAQLRQAAACRRCFSRRCSKLKSSSREGVLSSSAAKRLWVSSRFAMVLESSKAQLGADMR